MMDKEMIEVNAGTRILLEWHPEVCGGQIVLHGTRRRVDIIFDLINAGESNEEIIENYPTITINTVNKLRWIDRYCRGETKKKSDDYPFADREDTK